MYLCVYFGDDFWWILWKLMDKLNRKKYRRNRLKVSAAALKDCHWLALLHGKRLIYLERIFMYCPWLKLYSFCQLMFLLIFFYILKKGIIYLNFKYNCMYFTDLKRWEYSRQSLSSPVSSGNVQDMDKNKCQMKLMMWYSMHSRGNLIFL